VNFEINREKIARTLCVKKEEPKNCCQGSCHLKKQLQEEEKKERTPASSMKLIKQIQLFCYKNILFTFHPSLLTEKASTPFEFPEAKPFAMQVFHPPC
jgi:hypothetical protein